MLFLDIQTACEEVFGPQKPTQKTFSAGTTIWKNRVLYSCKVNFFFGCIFLNKICRPKKVQRPTHRTCQESLERRYLRRVQQKRRKKEIPGNSAGDLFGVMICDTFNGCWWPPNTGSKGHFEPPGTELYFLLFISSSHFFGRMRKQHVLKGDVSGNKYLLDKRGKIEWMPLDQTNNFCHEGQELCRRGQSQ